MKPYLKQFLKRTRTTKHPWLIACDANMTPEDFEKKPLVSKRANANVRDGTRWSVNVQIEKWVEKVYDYVFCLRHPQKKEEFQTCR